MKLNKVVIIGGNGKMGKIVQESLTNFQNFNIIGLVNRGDNLEKILQEAQPNIVIDVSSHESVKKNAICILKNNIKAIIGASGLSVEDIQELELISERNNIGCLVIPNFSIAFAFINKVTKDFAKYYQDISIVEFHHAQKKDKPSGTARYTAAIAGIDEKQIASVRSSGFLAKQQLYINSDSERIIIDHESFSRSSFIKGIQISAEKIVTLNKLLVGLENIV
jgi:4-hydroxy-tetrahydrodipicolinate reductase